MTKITKQMWPDIVKMYEPGVSLKSIAAKYGVTGKRISQIIRLQGGPSRSTQETYNFRYLNGIPSPKSRKELV